jgi:hypothetical protein
MSPKRPGYLGVVMLSLTTLISENLADQIVPKPSVYPRFVLFYHSVED